MKKVIGIILIVLAVLAVISGFSNGTFENQNIGFYIGYLGGAAALAYGGYVLIKKSGK